MMPNFKKYIFNADTLSYEVSRESVSYRIVRGVVCFVLTVLLALFYFWIYTSVLGKDLPKTLLLKKENAEWASSIEMMNHRIDVYESALEEVQMRDNDIYRSVFGMNEVSPEVRDAGFGGVGRYARYDGLDSDGLLKKTVVRLDRLLKKSYVQSKSFDEVALLSKRAGDMALCIPAIAPINPDSEDYRISSYFGSRQDPITGGRRTHKGMDFAMKPGHPIYVTGDGVVERVSYEFYGYGHSVTVDHGFGYKTKYAHLKSMDVVEGMTVRRGDRIALSGNTGRSTGPHLHYEVLYKDRPLNPLNYMDLNITSDEYVKMVREPDYSGAAGTQK